MDFTPAGPDSIRIDEDDPLDGPQTGQPKQSGMFGWVHPPYKWRRLHICLMEKGAVWRS